MFINRAKNKSGTTSVRVLEKRGCNNVLVRSFGSSSDEKEINRMVEDARIFIQRQTGTYQAVKNHVKDVSGAARAIRPHSKNWVESDLGNA